MIDVIEITERPDLINAVLMFLAVHPEIAMQLATWEDGDDGRREN